MRSEPAYRGWEAFHRTRFPPSSKPWPEALKYDNAYDDPEYWTPPHEGLATRRPARKSEKTRRGFAIFKGIRVYHESRIERCVCYVLMSRPDVAELHSQFPVVEYFDAAGVLREHVFDFYFVSTTGIRTVVMAKPGRKRVELQALADLIERDNGDAHFDEIIIMTDKDATYADFGNAVAVLRARKHAKPAEVDVVRAIVSGLPGRFRMAELFRGCEDVKRRRNAVFFLIGARVLEPLVEHQRIHELSWLRQGDGFQSLPRRLRQGA